MCGHRPLLSESERRSRPVFGAAVYQNQFVEVLAPSCKVCQKPPPVLEYPPLSRILMDTWKALRVYNAFLPPLVTPTPPLLYLSTGV